MFCVGFDERVGKRWVYAEESGLGKRDGEIWGLETRRKQYWMTENCLMHSELDLKGRLILQT
jgi:hypothetical protein